MPNDAEIRVVMAATELGDTAAFNIRVTTKEALARALRQRQPVVIGDKKLARLFERLLWAQELRLWAQELRWWLVPFAIYCLANIISQATTQAISQRYDVKFGADWHIGRNSGSGEIILTPPKPAPPHSSPPDRSEQ
jgi:hypothetical protein